jgi:hypothetical protein
MMPGMPQLPFAGNEHGDLAAAPVRIVCHGPARTAWRTGTIAKETPLTGGGILLPLLSLAVFPSKQVFDSHRRRPSARYS